MLINFRYILCSSFVFYINLRNSYHRTDKMLDILTGYSITAEHLLVNHPSGESSFSTGTTSSLTSSLLKSLPILMMASTAASRMIFSSVWHKLVNMSKMIFEYSKPPTNGMRYWSCLHRFSRTSSCKLREDFRNGSSSSLVAFSPKALAKYVSFLMASI